MWIIISLRIFALDFQGWTRLSRGLFDGEKNQTRTELTEASLPLVVEVDLEFEEKLHGCSNHSYSRDWL